MKWKPKEKVIPRQGDIKIKTKFAWLPVELDNGYKVWLERYNQYYMYSNVPVWDYMGRYNELKWKKWCKDQRGM